MSKRTLIRGLLEKVMDVLGQVVGSAKLGRWPPFTVWSLAFRVV